MSSRALTRGQNPTPNQPSKADLEEPIVIRKADGSMPSTEEFARVALHPVNVAADPEV